MDIKSSKVWLACRQRRWQTAHTSVDTLIVWTEQNGADMALSFQEAEGCAAIWSVFHRWSIEGKRLLT